MPFYQSDDMSTTTSTNFTLPVKGLRAKDLPRYLLPNKLILQSYKEVGKEGQYERTGYDRNYDRFWALVNATKRLAEQLIEQKVSGLMRIKDAKGKEWLTYHVSLYGHDWEGNTVDFFYMNKVTDGCKDGLPIWSSS